MVDLPGMRNDCQNRGSGGGGAGTDARRLRFCIRRDHASERQGKLSQGNRPEILPRDRAELRSEGFVLRLISPGQLVPPKR